MERRYPKNSAALLSWLLAFSLPVLLALYWPLTGLHFTWVPAALRGGLAAITGLFAMLWWKAPATKSERRWSLLLLGYLGLLLLDSFAADQIARSLQNALRILFLLVFCLLLARAFRHGPTRRAFGIGALVASLILSAYILACYVTFLGTSMPTYVSTRIFKATVQRVLGVGLNPLGFSASFFCMLAACTLRPTWMLNTTLAAVICICSVFTGSRTPLALLIVSLVAVVVIELARRYGKFRLFCLWFLLPAFVLATGYALRDGVDMRKASEITENRTDLWTVAWAKFTERPLTGYGADSWGDDLIERMPGLYQVTAVVVHDHAGGYHNAYVTLLAEGGIFLFGFAALIVVSAFRALNQTPGLTSKDRQRRALLLFTLIFLVLRGFIEVPGWFGYGEDPAEFSCYALLALIISAVPEVRLNRAAASSHAALNLTLPQTRLAQ